MRIATLIVGLLLCLPSWGSYHRNTAIFRQTSSVTVTNTVVETTLVSTGIGFTTLPANYLQPGTTLKIRIYGTHTAASNPSVEVRITLGGTTILDSGSVASGNSTNALIDIEGWITIRTTGSGGTLFAQGWYKETTQTGALITFPMVNTSTAAVNTTITNLIDITYQWSTASVSDSVTATNLVIEETGA